MQTLKLHIKTTLLASVIIVGLLVAALVMTSAGIANLEREDDKALADTQAADLAQHISDMESPRDAAALTRTAAVSSSPALRVVGTFIRRTSEAPTPTNDAAISAILVSSGPRE